MPGRIEIYTGAGKGKTTAALGLLLRFLGSGGKACLIQFDKGAGDQVEMYSERALLTRMPGLTFMPTGCQRFDAATKTFRFENNAADFEEARHGLQLARQGLTQGYGLLVLDEILSLVMTKLASQDDIMELIEAYLDLGRPCELVLTGHALWPALKEKADLVTEMRKVKHYFDAGEQARRGIEY